MVEKEQLEESFYTIWLKTKGAGLILFYDRLTLEHLEELLKNEYRKDSIIVTKTTVEIIHER